MAKKQNWDNTKLQSYLLHDLWEPDQAMMVLAGFEMMGNYGNLRIKYVLDPSAFDMSANNINDIEEEMIERVRMLVGILESGNESNSKHPPAYFINWAISKRLPPEWLKWAIEKKLYKSDTPTIADHSFFNKLDPNYPVELDIALQVWKAISLEDKKGKPKARARDWLDANTKLSNEAKERISTVVNWDKTGGATKT
jgi:hypothetical protein